MPLQTLKRDSSAEKINDVMLSDGALILEDVVDEQQINDCIAELQHFIDVTPFGRDDFTGRLTKRTGALAARSATCRDFIVNSRILTAAETFLKPYSKKILLHLTQTILLRPGAGAQPFHRDRYAWGRHLPLALEPQFNTIWAMTDFTRANGATRVVPGSQHWDYGREPEESEVCYAEMSKGSVFLYSGSVMHAGGSNDTDQNRMGLNLTYCLNWLRQEENQYLSCPPEIARDFDPVLQDLLGYVQGDYALGYFSDPVDMTGQREVASPSILMNRGD